MSEQTIQPAPARVSRRTVTMSPEALVVWTSIFFAVFCNTRFWARITGQSSSLVFNAAIFVLVIAVHVLLLLPLSSRRILRQVLAILFLANAAAIYFMDRFGIYLDNSMLRNVMETDRAEAAQLLDWRMVPFVAAYAVAPALLLLFVRFPPSSAASAVRRKAVLLLAAMLTIVIVGMASWKDLSSILRNDREVRYLVTPANYVVSVARVAASSRPAGAARRTPVGDDAVLGPAWQTSTRPVLFVLVLGETARAASFSLNGYARETNPLLHRRGDLISFRDVSSCGTSTAESLPCMFSPFGRMDPDRGKARQYESLLDVLEHGRLDVVWYENNSGCKGVCDRVEVVNLKDASRNPSCASGECLDEILLEALEGEISRAGRGTVVVLHQQGSHGPAYHRRYPSRFRHFVPACEADGFGDCTQEEIRNAYDNSILYTDYVLDGVIERLERASATADTAMLYVSDHGESIGENGVYLHGLPYAIAPRTQTRVPMLLWMSPSFEQRFGIDRNRTRELARSEPHSHDQLFHSVLGALQVRTSVYRRDRDVVATVNENNSRAVAFGR